LTIKNKQKKNKKKQTKGSLIRVLDSVIQIAHLVVGHVGQILFVQVCGQARPKGNRQFALGVIDLGGKRIASKRSSKITSKKSRKGDAD